MDTGGVLQLLNFRQNMFRIQFIRREWDEELGGGVPSLIDWVWGNDERRELPQRGLGRSPGRQRIFGIFEVHRTLLVERTVLLY